MSDISEKWLKKQLDVLQKFSKENGISLDQALALLAAANLEAMYPQIHQISEKLESIRDRLSDIADK